MSYDISIGSADFNYTWNVSKLFHEHLPATDERESGLYGLNGMTGKQAGEELARAFDRIDRSVMIDWTTDAVGEPAFCARYDADNGWGSTVGALVFLARVMAACHASPRAKFRAS